MTKQSPTVSNPNYSTEIHKIKLEIGQWFEKNYPQLFDPEHPKYQKNIWEEFEKYKKSHDNVHKNIWEEFEKYKKSHDNVHNNLKVKLHRMAKKEGEASGKVQKKKSNLFFYDFIFSLLLNSFIFGLSLSIPFIEKHITTFYICANSFFWMRNMIMHYGPQPGG